MRAPISVPVPAGKPGELLPPMERPIPTQAPSSGVGPGIGIPGHGKASTSSGVNGRGEDHSMTKNWEHALVEIYAAARKHGVTIVGVVIDDSGRGAREPFHVLPDGSDAEREDVHLALDVLKKHHDTMPEAKRR